MTYRFDRLKVLVVDDNPHMRVLIGALLKAYGMKDVAYAESGEVAWTKLNEKHCDIVLLDWVMGGMSGLDLAAKIRTAPDTPNPFVPIVMLTGHTSLDHVNAARDAGINEFLAKPVAAKSLLGRLVTIIEHPRPYVRTRSYFGPCRRRRNTNAYHGPERRSGENAAFDPAAAEDAA